MKEINIEAFIQRSPFYIKQLPRKLESKRSVLRELMKHIPAQCVYSEKEITQHLASFYQDPVELRRYLVDFHFMKRAKDGSCYEVLQEEEA